MRLWTVPLHPSFFTLSFGHGSLCGQLAFGASGGSACSRRPGHTLCHWRHCGRWACPLLDHQLPSPSSLAWPVACGPAAGLDAWVAHALRGRLLTGRHMRLTVVPRLAVRLALRNQVARGRSRSSHVVFTFAESLDVCRDFTRSQRRRIVWSGEPPKLRYVRQKARWHLACLLSFSSPQRGAKLKKKWSSVAHTGRPALTKSLPCLHSRLKHGVIGKGRGLCLDTSIEG